MNPQDTYRRAGDWDTRPVILTALQKIEGILHFRRIRPLE
jgi:hypothetical protein